ncbi:MAG: septum formation protein Maf [Gammaproteobacteria bacterium RIFCSPLOWO2_02_FULL_61_13]|nr:MAG: septum formation protein Maf [Gammaproteobacteria bacterium RIFCSPLOWO2_02_FULL_61_13]
MTDCDLLLASRSPRRRQLLLQLGVHFQCLDLEVNERPHPGESVAELVPRLALAKAHAGVAQASFARPVLGADTEVVLDGEVLGKPADFSTAVTMLRRLSGRDHLVYSAVALAHRTHAVLTSVTRVSFRALTPEEIETYCRRGESLDKAGGYGIQGSAAAFIERIEGSYSGVVGLPLFETATLLSRFDITMGRSLSS